MSHIREWVDIVTECLTAVGTVGAVIVALYFSRQDRKPRLSVRGFVIRVVNDGQTYNEGLFFVRITAVNTGLVPITVEMPCWRVGFFRRKVLYQLPPGFPGSGGELARYGQTHTITFSQNEFLHGWTVLRDELSKRVFPRIALFSLRCGYSTSTEKRFFGPLNWELKRLIRNDLHAAEKAKHSRQI